MQLLVSLSPFSATLSQLFVLVDFLFFLSFYTWEHIFIGSPDGLAALSMELAAGLTLVSFGGSQTQQNIQA